MNDLTTKELQTLDSAAKKFAAMYGKRPIIPIIGEEILFIKNNDGSQIPLTEYVISKFEEEYPDEDFIYIKPNFNNSYYAYSCIINIIGYLNFEESYIQFMDNVIRQDLVIIDPIYLDFLKTFQFPLIITTSCFDIIEKILNQHLTTKYSPIYYNPDKENSEPNFEDFLKSKHAIYYIFGFYKQMDEKISSKWVYDEETLLDYIHYIHHGNGRQRSCVNLTSYTDYRKAYMLILGCTLPDWLFRFLWYPFGSKDKGKRKGYWLRESECNTELKDFLGRINYSSLSMVKEFLKLATEKMKTRIDAFQEQEKKDKSEIQNYDFFISHASEDNEISLALYKAITAKGYKVYYDNEGPGKIKNGANFINGFSAGVKQSNQVILLITENYMNAAIDSTRGLYNEVQCIIKKKKDCDSENPGHRFCLPIIVKGRSYYEDPITVPNLVNWAKWSSRGSGLETLFKEIRIETYDVDEFQNITWS